MSPPAQRIAPPATGLSVFAPIDGPPLISIGEIPPGFDVTIRGTARGSGVSVTPDNRDDNEAFTVKNRDGESIHRLTLKGHRVPRASAKGVLGRITRRVGLDVACASDGSAGTHVRRNGRLDVTGIDNVVLDADAGSIVCLNGTNGELTVLNKDGKPLVELRGPFENLQLDTDGKVSGTCQQMAIAPDSGLNTGGVVSEAPATALPSVETGRASVGR